MISEVPGDLDRPVQHRRYPLSHAERNARRRTHSHGYQCIALHDQFPLCRPLLTADCTGVVSSMRSTRPANPACYVTGV